MAVTPSSFVFRRLREPLSQAPGPPGPRRARPGWPRRFALFQADFVLAFPLAFRRAAEMRQVGNPEDAVQRNVFIVDCKSGMKVFGIQGMLLRYILIERPRGGLDRGHQRVRSPPWSRAFRPAMVVPPGLATRSFSTPGCSPLESDHFGRRPATVWAARAAATSRGSPMRTPPSLEGLDHHVDERRAGTRQARSRRPAAFLRPRRRCRRRGATARPAGRRRRWPLAQAVAEAPQPTRQGVLGIARTSAAAGRALRPGPPGGCRRRWKSPGDAAETVPRNSAMTRAHLLRLDGQDDESDSGGHLGVARPWPDRRWPRRTARGLRADGSAASNPRRPAARRGQNPAPGPWPFVPRRSVRWIRST